MINIVSAGEITVGMYVIVYESFMPLKRVVSSTEELPAASEEEFERNISPWYKGIPYEVVAVAGPILAVKTGGFQNLPPICFIDTRLNKFIEVDKDYNDTYHRYMSQPKPVEPVATGTDPSAAYPVKQ